MAPQRYHPRSPAGVLTTMLLFRSATGGTFFAFQPSPCFTGRQAGSLSCPLPLGFVPEFRRADLGDTASRKLKLHLSNDKTGKGSAAAEQAKEKLHSAAAFVAMKLQMVALTKAMEEEATGGGENSAKILENIEKMMQPPAPSKKKKKADSKPSSKSAPPPEKKKEPTIELKVEKPAIGLKRTPSGTGTLPREPMREDAEVQVIVPPAPAKIEIPPTKTPSKPPAQPKPALATAATSRDVVSTKGAKEEPEPAAASQVDTAKEVDTSTTTTATATGLIPPCISTDFGQALPTLVEDLPPLREPIAFKPKPKPADAPKAEAAVQDKTTATKAVIVPPPPAPAAKTEEVARVLTTPPPPKPEVTSADDDKKDKEAPKVLVTPPPPAPEPKAEDKDKEPDVVKDEEATKEDISSSARVLVPPPPKEEDQDDQKSTPNPAKVIIPPPPSPPVENKAEAVEPPAKAAVSAAPPPKTEESKAEAVPTPSPTKGDNADDDQSKKYAEMPLGERAASILEDLGMIEHTLDPDDPNYDHSNDDEISPGQGKRA